MEMRRYVRHSPAWWAAGLVLAALAVVCFLLGAAEQGAREDAAPTPLGDTVYLDDYNYIDVQYMTDWVYRVNLGDGSRDTFYIAWDAEGYGYLVLLTDEQYAAYADIVAYTYSDDSDLAEAAGQAEDGASELAMYIPLTEAAAPAPVRLAGIIRSTPAEYIADIADADGMTSDDFINTYGDYYIDGTSTPAVLDNDWLDISVLLTMFALVLLAVAGCYSAQLRSTLKLLKKGKLLDRAESEFHYLEGDRRSDALVSTAFLYGRRQNIVLPLADVLWVYRHDMRLLWAKRTVVQLMTYDGRSITLRLSRGGSRRSADALVQAVSARNPEALAGLTRENHRLYAQQVPHAKRRRTLAAVGGAAAAAGGYARARLLIRLLLP